MVYIAYGETDDFAHDSDYEAYLKSAKNTDTLIKELWYYTQKDPFYKNNTVFIITLDHGRGTDPLKAWISHGGMVKGAGSVWMVMFGKGVKAMGEVAQNKQMYSDQIAPTILNILGLKLEIRKNMANC